MTTNPKLACSSRAACAIRISEPGFPFSGGCFDLARKQLHRERVTDDANTAECRFRVHFPVSSWKD
jgi:hypothetical protein